MAAEFEILRAQSGGFFWRLQGNNNEILGHSEVMTTKQSAISGAEAVKRVAPTAPIKDKA